MLTVEEKMMIDRLKKIGQKIENDYTAGFMTEKKYQECCKIFDDAEEKILAISNGRITP